MSDHRRSSLRSSTRSRSRSRSRQGRPSLGSRKNSNRSSFISIKDELIDSSITSSISTPTSQGNVSETEIPFINASLDHTLPVGYFKQDLLTVLKNLRISKWHKLPSHVSSDIKIQQISGALTNAIFKVDPPSVVILKNLGLHNTVFPSLLLRIYGPNVESLIDRDYELKILVRLSKQNIGPKLFGCFNNGRVEQFLDNATTLTRNDIRDKKTSARIARRMKELHLGIKLSKAEKQQGPTVWRIIDKWIAHIDELITQKKLNLNEIEIFNTAFTTFKKAVETYRKWLLDRYSSPEELNDSLVFCHNDTQYGNLLFTTPVIQPNKQATSSQTSLTTNFSNLSLEHLQDIKPSVQEQKQDRNLVVIDFEYSGPNVASYDIANHFSEWMHDYHHPTTNWKIFDKDFPTLDEQLNLIYSYILFRNESFDLSQLEKEAKLLYNDCICWRPTVAISWALWAIIQNGDNQEQEAEEIVEMGPNGEMYKIIKGDKEDGSAVESDIEDEEDKNSADVDNFEYLNYAQDKISCFWGDVTQLGIFDKDHLDDKEKIKLLPTEFYKF